MSIKRLVVPTAIAIAVLILLAWAFDERHRLDLNQLLAGSLVVLEVIGVLLLFILVIALIIWLCQPEGLAISPIDNPARVPNFDGAAFATYLASELQRVKGIHAGQQDFVSHDQALPPVVLSRRDKMADSVLSSVAPGVLADKIAAIGTVEFAGTKVALGQVLLTLKQTWPFRKRGSLVSGHVYRYNSSLRLRLELVRAHGGATKVFSIPFSASDADDEFSHVVWQAAARIAHAFSVDQEGISWENFGFYTNALEGYQDFLLTRSSDALAKARSSVQLIDRRHRRNENIRALIYDLGIGHLEIREIALAEDLFTEATRIDPRDAVAWNALGVTYFERRDLDKARSAFARAASLEPTYPRSMFFAANFKAHPWNGLGNTYVELGRYPDAIESYRKAIRLASNAAYPRFGLGNAFLQQKRLSDAEDAYRQAIKLNSEYAYPWYGLGNVCASNRKFEDAVAYHQKALELDKNFAHAWSGLGEAYARLGKLDDSISAHKTAIALRSDDPYLHNGLAEAYLLAKRVDGAREEVRRALGLDSNAAYALRTQGDIFRMQGSFAEAIDAYRKALDLNPNDSRVWDGLAKATRDLDSGKLEDIIAYNQRAVDNNRPEPYSWNQLGQSYYDAGQYQESIDAHAEALQLDPDNAYALDGIGKARLALGEFAEAIAAHRRAAALNDEDEYAFHGVAAALLATGDFAGAVSESLRAVQINPNQSYAWNGLGDAYERERKYDDAIECYTRALQVSACDAYSQNGMARVHLEQEKLDEALAASEAALSLKSNAPYALVTRGEIYVRQRRFGEAVDEFRKALVFNPRDSLAWDGLGKALTWLGDYASASEAYSKGLEFRVNDWRLTLGAIDVSLKREVDRGNLRQLEDLVLEYLDCARLHSMAAFTARIRLSLIAAVTDEDRVSVEDLNDKQDTFALAWKLRYHSDADLHELRSLKLLLDGDPEASLDALKQAVPVSAVPYPFDSERIGAYDLLKEAAIEGAGPYVEYLSATTLL